MALEIRPCHIREAQEYIKRHHRHSIPPVGGKFAIACCMDSQLCGVAVCGRPVARHSDDGQTLEILRCCTDGTPNACSKLYGACCQIGFRMGYDRIITYTLESEYGASLRAAGFLFDGICGREQWTGSRRRSYYVSPPERKQRWIKKKPQNRKERLQEWGGSHPEESEKLPDIVGSKVRSDQTENKKSA